MQGPPKKPSRDQELKQAIGQELQAIVRLSTALTAQLRERLGVHGTDERALHVLDLAAGANLTVGTIGTRLGLSRAASTQLVDRLEKHGLVERVRDATDRRRVFVALTPAARRLGQSQLRPLAEAMTGVVAATPRTDLSSVRDFLERFRDALERLESKKP